MLHFTIINFLLTLINTFHLVTKQLSYRLTCTLLVIKRTEHFVHFLDFISVERKVSTDMISHITDLVLPLCSQFYTIRINNSVIDFRCRQA
ncbi:hypothetical protein EVA_06872 [gut metagenome]|uniref:Uncharacterized protein n=1 Tax=gut metagenome TaxID=749906 RepID=J9GR77_9ZZZZ